ncbi:hypothetical protein OEA41_009548 [Lepraria neglecta]|uniref:Uncharacterized protein n=1 Tax=Lepraria neglecta TaxID=209136 RepID=A0AAD9Z4H3_9LECA|nr:hypothetical protein OEA41_009548 [Lepraria neglecta]
MRHRDRLRRRWKRQRRNEAPLNRVKSTGTTDFQRTVAKAAVDSDKAPPKLPDIPQRTSVPFYHPEFAAKRRAARVEKEAQEKADEEVRKAALKEREGRTAEENKACDMTNASLGCIQHEGLMASPPVNLEYLQTSPLPPLSIEPFSMEQMPLGNQARTVKVKKERQGKSDEEVQTARFQEQERRVAEEKKAADIINARVARA